MTEVIRRKTWEQRRDEKISAEYVRLSKENRELKEKLLNTQLRLAEILAERVVESNREGEK
jgi:hypothetical protein